MTLTSFAWLICLTNKTRNCANFVNVCMWINLTGWFTFSSYHLQTKLQEGNVFTDVCLFTGWGCKYIPYIMGYVTWPPTSDQGTYPSPLDIGSRDLPSGPCYWHLVVITGDLYKLVLLKTSPPPTDTDNWHLVAATGTCIVGMRAVRILLESWLVSL